MKHVNHIVTNQTVTVVLNDGQKDHVYTISKNSDLPRYQAVLAAIKLSKAERDEALPGILDSSYALRKGLGEGGWKLEAGRVSFNGENLPDCLTKKFLAVASAGNDVDPLKRFWERCAHNKILFSRNQLFSFIEKNGVTINPDGTFVLYKGIREDWTSHHDRTTLHKIGSKLEELVHANLDPQVSCGRGYHAAPWQYVRNHYSGGRVVEVFIDPKDVISVPHEDAKKIRCWNYLVHREITGHDDPRVLTNQNVKTADLSDPKPAQSAAGTVMQAVKKAIRKIVRKIGLSIEATTDRITIPSTIVLEHGFKAGGSATVWATDPRSRFVLACPSDLFESITRNQKVAWSKEVLLTSTGSLSIRAAVLAQAKIWTGSGTTYKITDESAKVLYIKPA